MKVIQEKKEFTPIIITLETMEEYEGFRNMLKRSIEEAPAFNKEHFVACTLYKELQFITD